MSIATAGTAQATGGGSDVCQGLDSGKIDVSGSKKTITITAPAGTLITGYCVKAGSSHHGNGPVYLQVQPPSASVTISYPGGKDISHYSYSVATIATPAAPTFVDPTCEVPSASMTGAVDTSKVNYTVTGTPAPGATVTVTAAPKPGYVFLPGVTKSWTHTFKTIESLDCDVEVTPVAPVVNQSTTCDVEGSYTIPSTEGVDYYVGGVLKAPGTYSGPINATVTATAKDGYELDNPEWSAPIVIAAAEKCPVRVTPESPTVLQSEACEVEGSFTVPTTGGVEYLLGDQVVTGTVTGPVTGTLTARALPGHVLTNPEWSYSIDIPAAEDCPVEVVPVEPTVVQSEVCEIEGTYTIPATTGLQYLLDDEPIAAGDYTGPVDGVVTAQALPGYVVSSDGPWSYDLVVAPAADCPPTATPVAPTVAQSEVCDVEGTYTIPVTPGVQYLLDGVEIAAGDYTGPKTGTLTAEGVEGTVLTDPEWSFDLDVLAAADCPEVLPTEEVDVCTNIAGPQSAVPAGYTEKDGVCTEVAGTETEKPTPEVLGVQQEVPTAVNAGLGDIAPTTSSSGMLGQGLLGGGMVMLLLAAWLKFGRVERGAHQV